MLSRELVEFWPKDCPDLNFKNLIFVTTRFFEYYYFGKTTKVEGPFLSAGIFNILEFLRIERSQNVPSEITLCLASSPVSSGRRVAL
jgi:hypothetical protein